MDEIDLVTNDDGVEPDSHDPVLIRGPPEVDLAVDPDYD